MSRWFRFYDDAINDPKILKLPEAMRWYWTAVLCIASKNDGDLPPIADIALMLRLTTQRAAAVITQLVAAGLLDKVGNGFSPHNWSGRQYKSDVSTERVKRFRNGKRNVSGNEDEAFQERPQKQTTETDTEQSRADAPRAVVNGSEKALRSDLMEIFPGAPNYDRTAVWLGKGYAPSMIREVVKELLARKPDIANLAYFDAALAERHGKRAETPSERAAGAAALDYDKVVAMFAKTGHWSRYAGPEPGLTGCKASPELLAQYGIAPDGRKLAMAS